MGILGRIARSFRKSDEVDIAERLGQHLELHQKALHEDDDEAATGHLREIDQLVFDYTKARTLEHLRLPVEHWAASIAPPELTLAVAIFFGNNDKVAAAVKMLERDGSKRGTGLWILQEGFNRAGLIMGPTSVDVARTKAGRQADGVPNADPSEEGIAQSIAVVLWPESDRETYNCSRVASLGRVSVERAKLELFALRTHAANLASLGIFRPDEPLRKRLITRGETIVRERPDAAKADFDSWLPKRHARYSQASAEAMKGADQASADRSTLFLAEIRRAFQECLDSDDIALGLVGGAAYDRAFTNVHVLCEKITQAMEEEFRRTDGQTDKRAR